MVMRIIKATWTAWNVRTNPLTFTVNSYSFDLVPLSYVEDRTTTMPIEADDTASSVSVELEDNIILN